MGKNQHVVPAENGWGVRGEGNERLTSIHDTQAEAEAAAREIAINQQSEVVIHRPDGRIRDKNSYGNDPHPPRG
jgi:cytochrome b